MIICRFQIIIIPNFPLLDSTIYDFLRYAMLQGFVTVRIYVHLSVLYKFCLYIFNIYIRYIFILDFIK